MITREELALAVREWIVSTPAAREAANWLLDRATVDGQIPKRPTFDVDVPWRDAIASFFSAAYVRLSNRGRKLTLDFRRWEQDHVAESGLLLAVLADACGRTLVNRRKARLDRAQQLAEVLQRYANEPGFPSFVAKSELIKLADQQGRFWSRSARWDEAQIDFEISRYFELLRYATLLRSDASRLERIVHVSRSVAGDTHWLRPRNQMWRDLADDILAFDPELASRFASTDVNEVRRRVLEDVGIVENLTSVTVLVFGRFALQRGTGILRWPDEAADQGLPIWLSALHLDGAEIDPVHVIAQVVSVENETSFLDRIEQLKDDRGTILVYTEGHANRAVMALLRLIAHRFPSAAFYHEGDLDLPGVRILASLAERSGLRIQPRNMDVRTYDKFEAMGIDLTDDEHACLLRDLGKGGLPCKELLERIAENRKRVEQESITATSMS